MNIICGNRQTGRTTELIKKCSRYMYALIVCPTQKRAEYVFRMAIDAGYNIPMPISFREFVEQQFFAPNIDTFLFDDLDLCLNTYAKGVPIDSVVFEMVGNNVCLRDTKEQGEQG